MGKITNIQSLELEMEKLKLRMRSIENKLDQNIDDLRENVGSMAFNTVIGEERKQKLNSFWSGLTEKFMDNPRLQGTIGRWVDKIADKIADTLDPSFRESESQKAREENPT